MELRHLKYFMMVAEELHFGKAAKKLFITQPPLSRQIKMLEEDLGVTLFERTKKRVRLTAHGFYLKEEAAKVFVQIESMRNHIRLIEEGTEGLVKIGYVGSAMHSVLPGVLSAIRRALPGVHTSLSELKNLDQIAGLKYGNIDIGFIRTPITAEGLEIQPIYSETLSIIVPRSHPSARSKALRLADLAGEPFIGFCRECAPGLFDMIIGLCNREGFSPRIVHESSQINSVVRLVESGLGYSIVPTSVRTGYNVQIRFHELANCPERTELALAYDPEHRTPTSERVIKLVLGLKAKLSSRY
jgi:DNA-binding transcriptional LysR family regulator